MQVIVENLDAEMLVDVEAGLMVTNVFVIAALLEINVKQVSEKYNVDTHLQI